MKPVLKEGVPKLAPSFVGKVGPCAVHQVEHLYLTVSFYIGTAALCLMSEHMTTIRQRIDVPVPRKSAGSETHDKGLERFYSTLYTAFLRVIPFSTLKVIVIASPGFVKDSVYDYFFAEATKTSNKALLQARKKFVRVHVSSPHVHSLVEVLKSPEVSAPFFCSDVRARC